ncbi:syntaxin-7-like [Ctenocephalides felis]|uniref:syntaxin-7-like n=1 Tax=Ctenocephalides felis TaxID=7515 RepID=UPI000E6E10D4|nr:syntaxin-7-like [Ctenocephalides felis]XP_026473784.1 syntaxin-7-like [Ctenocephalides felis]
MDGYSSFHNGSVKEPDYDKLSNTIGSNIQKISQNVLSMKRMVNQLGTSQDSQDLQQQLHQIQSYTQQLVKDTNTLFTTLKKANFGPEQRHLKIQRDRLADEFTNALNSLQATHREAVQRERNCVNEVRAAAKLNNFKPPPASNKDQLLPFQSTHSQQQMQAQIQEEIDLQALQTQEENIRQLEHDIRDVNEIFKNLGALVHEQGDIIDSIEASVERTQVFVENGTQQLRQASQYKTKLRKKKLILLLIAIVVLAILIGIIVYSTKS